MTSSFTIGAAVRHTATERTGRVIAVQAAQGKHSRIRSTIKVQFAPGDDGWFRPEDLTAAVGPVPLGGLVKP